MILDLVFWPDTRLKQLCEPVPEVTDAVRWLIREMEETLVFARAAGLAAPQVGRALRVVTVRENDTGKPVSLVNPRIVELSPERLLMREGCLSLPGYWEKVSRAVWARVEGLNAHGEPVELQAEGLMAQALQHEVEHLDGVLFIDHLSALKRGVALRQVKKKLSRMLDDDSDPEYEDAT